MIAYPKISRLTVALTALTAALTGFSAAQSPAPAKPVLVELFLSQSCSSCLPAAKMFPEIAARNDVVALAWHVDYWDTMHTENGQWKDRHAIPASSERQKRYNLSIRNRSSVYTPQFVVEGEQEGPGAKQAKLTSLIEAAPRTGPGVKSITEDGQVRFEVGESDDGGNAYLVIFKKRALTNISGGENAGKALSEVNVVTEMRPLGVVLRRGAKLTAPIPAEGEGCALIVQAPQQTQVIAAAYCAI